MHIIWWPSTTSYLLVIVLTNAYKSFIYLKSEHMKPVNIKIWSMKCWDIYSMTKSLYLSTILTHKIERHADMKTFFQRLHYRGSTQSADTICLYQMWYAIIYENNTHWKKSMRLFHDFQFCPWTCLNFWIPSFS